MIEAVRARLTARFQPSVLEPWLGTLPELLARLAAAWDLRELEPLDAGGTSVVVRCVQARTRAAVLKATPDPSLAAAEADALRAWAATGAVPQLWEADRAAGAVLLELVPGTVGARADTDVEDLLARLHAVPPPPGTPPLRDRVAFVWDLWTPRVAGMARTRERALALADDYAGPPALLHGDLHPGNVLVTARGLVAIDPRPCAGDPAFDAVDWPTFPGPRAAAWREVFAPLLARA